MKEAALEVGAWLGAPVIPLAGKRPVPGLGSWAHLIGRRLDSAAASGLPWGQADGYGVVIPPGVIVLDLDVDESGSLETAKKTLAAAGLLEVARACRHWVRTKRGGRHLYFSAGGLDTRRLPVGLGPNVEIKRVGHYVVGPGSFGYEWGRGGPEAGAPDPIPFLFAASKRNGHPPAAMPISPVPLRGFGATRGRFRAYSGPWKPLSRPSRVLRVRLV